jgi:pimeloyl-ACP methyl ester carboxylesterase
MIHTFNHFQLWLLVLILIILFIPMLGIIFFVFSFLILLEPIFKIYYKRKYKLKTKPKECIKVFTKDGFIISIHRTRPEKIDKKKLPVLLCHGVIANYKFMDLDKKNSIAEFLSEQGYDVYNVSLRGTSSSEHPKGRMDHSIDDHISDIELIIEKVLEITNQKQVHWIGHSMGALILFCYLAIAESKKSNKVKSFVSLGGPGVLYNIYPAVARILNEYANFFQKFDLVFLGRIFIPLMNLIPTRLIKSFYSPELSEKSIIKKALYSLENIPKSMIKQFMQSVILGGEIHSLNKKINYSEKFSRIKQKALFISGSRDLVVPIHSSKYVFEKISSKEKRFIYLTKENGTGNYGHVCLVLGENAKKDVFEEILKFLK